MPRIPRPWQRKSTGAWFVQIHGKLHYLGKDKAAATRKYNRLSINGIDATCTVEQLVRQYWSWLKKNHSAETAKRRKPALKSFLASKPVRIVRRKLASELKPYQVQAWAETWENPTTRGDRIGLIKTVWNWGVKQGYLDRSPIANMERPQAAVREDFVPAELWGKLVGLATDDQFRDWLTVMLGTGCRVNEMFTFTAAMFDGQKFTLPKRRSKGRKRSRVVYVPADVLPIVTRLVAENPTGPLFLNRKGRPWNRNSIRCRMRRLKKEMKMPWLTATHLRHSFAHHRLSNRQDSLVVAKLMGHVDTTMLAKRYGHLESNPGLMLDAANQVGLPSLQGTRQDQTV